MELGQQLKAHRKELGISQDELAEKIFVSRQSISNWENNKTYPDIHTLLLLAETFSVSLDELIKGDVEEMKEEIKTMISNLTVGKGSILEESRKLAKVNI